MIIQFISPYGTLARNFLGSGWGCGYVIVDDSNKMYEYNKSNGYPILKEDKSTKYIRLDCTLSKPLNKDSDELKNFEHISDQLDFKNNKHWIIGFDTVNSKSADEVDVTMRTLELFEAIVSINANHKK